MAQPETVTGELHPHGGFTGNSLVLTPQTPHGGKDTEHIQVGYVPVMVLLRNDLVDGIGIHREEGGNGVGLIRIDLFPPTRHLIHGVRGRIGVTRYLLQLPDEKIEGIPLTLRITRSLRDLPDTRNDLRP